MKLRSPHTLAPARAATNLAARRLAQALLLGIGLFASLLVLGRTAREAREDGWRAVFDSLGDGGRRLALTASAHGLIVGSSALMLIGLGGLALQRRRTASPLRLSLRRRPVDDALDWVRFRFDTFPRRPRLLRLLGPPQLARPGVYQDLPWVGLQQARRASSTRARWNAMLPLIEELDVRSAVDIGANVGWFCFAFDRIGIPAVAVEARERNVRIGLYARKRAPQPSRVSFLVMDVAPETADLLPSGDCMLFLSVWHHIVRARGLDCATRLLASLWEKTGTVLFFETGEGEMPESWGLPAMDPDARTWLTAYLRKTCPGARVVHLGRHDAGIENCGRPTERNLFAVVRDAGGRRRAPWSRSSGS